jgi:hypothetical protein
MMRADDVTDAAILAAKNGAAFVVVNYANPDMVGHTGDFNATVQACNHVAEQLERLIEEVQKLYPDAKFIITADHGNADDMSNGAHSKAPVLCVSINGEGPLRVDEAAIAYAEERIRQYDAAANGKINPDIVGNLGDVAPTLLAAAGLPIPRRIDDLDQYKDLVSQIIDERKEGVLRQIEARERAPSFALDFYGDDAYRLEEEAEKTLKDLEILRTTLIQEISDIQQQLRERGDIRMVTGSNLALSVTERHPVNERRQQRLDETPEYLAMARYITPHRGHG